MGTVQMNGDANKFNWPALDESWDRQITQQLRGAITVALIAKQHAQHCIRQHQRGADCACPVSCDATETDLAAVEEFIRSIENPTPADRVADIIRRNADPNDTLYASLTDPDIRALRACACAEAAARKAAV